MEAEKVLSQVHSTAPADFEVFSVRWSPDDSHLAAGCSDGTVKLYSGKFSTIIRTMNCRLKAETYPVTSVRWRPDKGLAKTKNVLAAITCDGAILHWHASSGKILHSLRIPDNQALCSDYNTEGTYFAVGCRDKSIKVFDEGTKEKIADLTGGDQQHLGHDNRIMSVKFIDHNYILSGGWDNNILIWDMRNTQVIRSFYGPRVYGDSLDVKGDTILAGSYNIEEQVQLWTMSDGRCGFSANLTTQGRSCMAYTAQFSKADNGKYWAVGGIGSTQLYIFEAERRCVVSQLGNIAKSVYSVDFANSSELLAVGSSDGTVKVFTYGEAPIESLDLEE
jgi:WD40 repeat protein